MISKCSVVRPVCGRRGSAAARGASRRAFAPLRAADRSGIVRGYCCLRRAYNGGASRDSTELLPSGQCGRRDSAPRGLTASEGGVA